MKSIYINNDLHKQLKMYSVAHNNSMTKLAENAIGNLVSQKVAKMMPAEEYAKQLMKAGGTVAEAHEKIFKKPNPPSKTKDLLYEP